MTLQKTKMFFKMNETEQLDWCSIRFPAPFPCTGGWIKSGFKRLYGDWSGFDQCFWMVRYITFLDGVVYQFFGCAVHHFFGCAVYNFKVND